MKFLSELIIFCVLNLSLFTVKAQDLSKCGVPPRKHLSECCSGFEKMFPAEKLTKCHEELQNVDDIHEKFCAINLCLAKVGGLVKNGQYDHQTSLTSLNGAVNNDTKWANHLNNVVKECENLGIATSPPAADVKCKSHFTGRMALCIFKYAMYPCPTSIATEECEKALKFFECTSTSTEVNY